MIYTDYEAIRRVYFVAFPKFRFRDHSIHHISSRIVDNIIGTDSAQHSVSSSQGDLGGFRGYYWEGCLAPFSPCPSEPA